MTLRLKVALRKHQGYSGIFDSDRFPALNLNIHVLMALVHIYTSRFSYPWWLCSQDLYCI